MPGSGRVSEGSFWCSPAMVQTCRLQQHRLPRKKAAREAPHHHLWVFGNGAPGKCGRSKAWHGRVVAAEVRILSASALRCRQRLKAEGRMSLDYESWVTGVAVESAELVGEPAMTAHASQGIGIRSSSVTSWACEAAAQAAGWVVEASTFASWAGLRMGWDAAVEEKEAAS